jgi:predicted DNA-binding transcriptional regulator YafY
MSPLREAMWAEEALDISYTDAKENQTERRIYPLTLSYHDSAVMVLAWCCTRQDFRMFHTTRILAIARTSESFRPRRVPLLRDYVKVLRTRDAKHGVRPIKNWPA